MSINRVIISGNIGQDPELRSTASGMPVLSFSVAVNDRRKDSSGEWTDYVNWISCTMFGSRAESVSRYIAKGSKVAVEGKLHYSQWETKEGQKRSKIDVIVDELEFMSSRNDSSSYGGGRTGGYSAPAEATMAAPVVDAHSSVYDEDLPF